MRQSPVKVILLNIIVTIGDHLLMLWRRGLTIRSQKVPSHYLGLIYENRVPVILLSGWATTWLHLRKLGDYISLHGHPVYVIPELKNNLIDIPTSAKIVRDFIEKNGIKNAVIVAHSKGGLIGKYMLAYYNKDKRIRGMVSVCTPYSGTALGTLFENISHLAELAPTSLIVKDLERHPGVNQKIISIYAVHDPAVWSQKKSYLEGALANIEVKTLGHHRLIFNKRGKELILEAIKRLS